MAKPPRSSDLVTVLRGLVRVGSAAVDVRSQEMTRAWATSSLLPAIMGGATKLQETLTSMTQQPQTVQKNVSKGAGEALARMSMVTEGLRAYRSSSVQPATEFPEKFDEKEDPMYDHRIEELNIEELLMQEASSGPALASLDPINYDGLGRVQDEANNIVDKAKSTSEEVSKRMEEFEPLLNIAKGDEREITTENLEILDRKVSELEGISHGHFFMAQGETAKSDFNKNTVSSDCVQESAEDTGEISVSASTNPQELSIENFMMHEAMSNYPDQLLSDSQRHIYNEVQVTTETVKKNVDEMENEINQRVLGFEPLLDIKQTEKHEITEEDLEVINEKLSDLQDVAFGHNLKIFKEVENPKPVEEVLHDIFTNQPSYPKEMTKPQFESQEQDLQEIVQEKDFKEQSENTFQLGDHNTEATIELENSISQIAKPVTLDDSFTSTVSDMKDGIQMEPIVEVSHIGRNVSTETEYEGVSAPSVISQSSNPTIPDGIKGVAAAATVSSTVASGAVAASSIVTAAAVSSTVAAGAVPAAAVSSTVASSTVAAAAVSSTVAAGAVPAAAVSSTVASSTVAAAAVSSTVASDAVAAAAVSSTVASDAVAAAAVSSTVASDAVAAAAVSSTVASSTVPAAAVSSTVASDAVAAAAVSSTVASGDVPAAGVSTTIASDAVAAAAVSSTVASTLAAAADGGSSATVPTTSFTSFDNHVTKPESNSILTKPKPKLLGRKPLAKEKPKSSLAENAQARKVPHSRISRLVSFGGLAAGLGMGTLAEVTRRTLGLRQGKGGGSLLDSSPFLTEANAKRIVDTLCRVRGAALKLGQMLSIQDSALINPQLQKIFERVRQSADFMPSWQLETAIQEQLGDDWRSKVATFDEKPFAAASIGQVHLATLHDGRSVAMKIQYPGVADGIESDINNLVSSLKVANIFPEGLFLDSVIEVAKKELRWECDYVREAECTRRFKELTKPYPELYVPEIIPELCTKQIIATELIAGIPVDKCTEIDQESRNYISEKVLHVCLMELFQFGFMQTDPNWSNFFYDAETEQVALLDFGACREYDKEFVDKYINLIHGAAVKDRDKVLKYSQELGFLTGYEAKVMVDAHIDAIMILGEAFQENKPFNFGDQDTTHRIQTLVPVMISHRMCAPPEEIYSLHRKMSGVFLLCAKLNGVVNCHSLFFEIFNNYKFGGTWEDFHARIQ